MNIFKVGDKVGDCLRPTFMESDAALGTLQLAAQAFQQVEPHQRAPLLPTPADNKASNAAFKLHGRVVCWAISRFVKAGARKQEGSADAVGEAVVAWSAAGGWGVGWRGGAGFCTIVPGHTLHFVRVATMRKI